MKNILVVDDEESILEIIKLQSWEVHDASDIFDRTIYTHVKNLRKKIEDNPKAPKYIKLPYKET